MTIEATFRAGGLASGLDTNTIIDSLVQVQQAPITHLKAQQDALTMQVSALGDLASKLSALHDAAAALKSRGVLALSASTASTAFSATALGGGTAGRYAVQVQALATAAKAKSASFGSAFDPVTGGTLTLSVMGTSYGVTLTDGMTLSDAASAINACGAPVSAVVLNDGTNAFLSLTNRDTGYPLSGAPGDALQVTESSTGTLGHALGLAVTAATNAQLTVDGVTFRRTSNAVADIVPGVQLTLKGLSAAPEDLVTGYDTSATQANLQGFVSAYNGVNALVQRALAIDVNTDRSKTLGGDAVVRNLQATLRGLTTTMVGTGTVRALADLGVKTAEDGSLSIDAAALGQAVARSPGAVDALFTAAGTGLSDVVTALTDRYTSASDGLIAARKDGLTKSISSMGDTLDRMNARLQAYKQSLIAQFSAMESVVSGLKSVGNFLTAQANAAAGAGK